MRAKILLLIGSLALLTVSSLAQEVTGDIRGTVKDPSGAVVPGALVTVTNTDKNIVIRTATTNQSGQYTASLLPVGHYTVTVDASGFRKSTRSGIELNVHDALTQDFSLQTGSATE